MYVKYLSIHNVFWLIQSCYFFKNLPWLFWFYFQPFLSYYINYIERMHYVCTFYVGDHVFLYQICCLRCCNLVVKTPSAKMFNWLCLLSQSIQNISLNAKTCNMPWSTLKRLLKVLVIFAFHVQKRLQKDKLILKNYWFWELQLYNRYSKIIFGK